VVWTFLGASVWIWTLPFRWRQCLGSGSQHRAAFLAIAFLPNFLFSAFVHIGDPDQALAGVALLSVAGGGALATLRWTNSDRQLFSVCAAAVFLHTVTFFYPPSRTAKAASYLAAAGVERMNRGALDAIATLRREGPLSIVHYGSSVATRHLYYYFPDVYVVVLPGSPGQPKPEDPVQVFYHRESVRLPSGASGLIGSGSRKIVCLLPWNAKPDDLPGASRFGAVYYLNRAVGSSIRIGPYRLIPAPAVTTSQASSSP
jgi:hypothetical protein